MGIKNKLNYQEYLYDFDVDGGTKDAAISLHAKDGKSVIPVGSIIQRVTAVVKTAVTATGAATVIWGNGDAANGYSGATVAKTTLALNAVLTGWDNAASLIWDDTNDHQLYVYVADAADGQFKVLIQTDDLLTGKIVFIVEYLSPAIDV